MIQQIEGKYTYRGIWQVAYPILISLFMEQMIGMTDTAFLGRVGEVELGASAIAGVYYMVIFVVGFGFSAIRFKNRGYASETQDVYLAGVPMNDALTGYTPFSLWSGLNEESRREAH